LRHAEFISASVFFGADYKTEPDPETSSG